MTLEAYYMNLIFKEKYLFLYINSFWKLKIIKITGNKWMKG